VIDAANAGVPNVTVNWSVTARGGHLSATATTTDQTGQTLVTLTLSTTAGTDTVSASVGQLTPAVFTATGVAASPAKLEIVTQPSNTGATVAFNPAVQVVIQDVYSNTATTATNNVTMAITSGTGTTGAILHGTLTKAAVSGMATFNDLSIDRSGTNFTLTASASGLTPDTSVQFYITAGGATHVAFRVQPTDITAGVAFNPAVQVAILDANNNVVTTATDTIYTNFTVSYGGTPRGTFKRLAVNGIATFDDLTIDKAHNDFRLQTMSLDRDLGVTASVLFNVNVGAAHRVRFTTQPRDVMVDVVFDSPLQLLVADNQGNTVTTSTASITLGITPGTGTPGAALVGTTTRSADTGIASFGGLSIDTPGTGYTVTASSPGLVSDTTVSFRAVGPFLNVTRLSAGLYQTNCALVSGGAAYCWGYNGNGQIGDGTTNGAGAPVAVSGGRTFTTISSGLHECGLVSGGAAYCWGLGQYGELGQGAYADSHTPTPVSGGLSFDSISTGTYHTCGLATGGTAYCWGDNGGFDLGDSSGSSANTPQRVVGGHTWAQVSAGYEHSCAVTPTGVGYCWGYGGHGALGDGGVTTTTWQPVLVSGGYTFSTIVAGGGEDSCGLTTGGVAYCWGTNGAGQLGIGTDTVGTMTPVPVAGGHTFSSISGGGIHYCAIATGGALYCWGLNRFGQLGDGTTSNRNAPVAVLGGLTFTSVSAGSDRTCGIATDGFAYCWGFNNGGALGDRTTTDRYTPVRVSAP